jgi:hypothetical protein
MDGVVDGLHSLGTKVNLFLFNSCVKEFEMDWGAHFKENILGETIQLPDFHNQFADETLIETDGANRGTYLNKVC